MFKIICDICGEEVKDNNFVFEATIMEVKDVVDMANLSSINSKPQMTKKQVQSCKDCYTEKIAKLFI